MRATLLALALVASTATPSWAQTSGDAQRLLRADGVPLFVVGVNYEGPADRAWQMWEPGKFDAARIEADFSRASDAGFNVLRLFVQTALAADVNAGRWDKLDQVVSLAEKHSLQLIVSLHDYGERDLARVSGTAGQVAQRYRGRAGILAFDLKNEPRFNDLSLATYTTKAPLQQRTLIDTFGERLKRSELAEYRASDEGVKTVPASMAEDDAWIYVNNLRLYREMLAEAATWVRERGFQRTTLDYLDDVAGRKWSPLVRVLNTTLEAWITPQLQAIRKADPTRAVTLDHVDGVLAKLPANDTLDYQSLHRYPGSGAASIRATLNLAASLQHEHAGKPFLLTEFGYATDSVDPDRASLHETAILLGLAAQGAGGGAKWMLNDMPQGFNMRERTLGAFQVDGSAKPIAAASAALSAYLRTTGSAPGDLRLEDDRDVGVRYVYRASDAVLMGGKKVDAGGASFEASGPAQLFITWTEPGVVRLWASAPLTATIDVRQLTGSGAGGATKLNLEPGNRVLTIAAPPARGADYAISGGRFFTQTNGRKDSPSGFGVTDEGGVPFWTAFQALGGVDGLGYPVTRRFDLDGFTVQAFQKAILQWRPEHKAMWFLNTFDVLHERGRDDWLEMYRQTPRPLDTAADAGLTWERVVARHLAMLDAAPPPLRERFLANPSWLEHYGLPVAVHELPNSVVVRAQRATLQYWKEDVPWAARGSVTIANGGDLAKEAGLFPWLAVTPENAPR